MILAVRTDSMPKWLNQTGFHRLDEAGLFDALERCGVWAGPREQLEVDESFRQLVPYAVLRNSDGIATYERANSGSEGRLHGRTSVGLGGHVEISDIQFERGAVDIEQTLRRSAFREIDEEVPGFEVTSFKWAGFLVDNNTSVGRVHMGVVAEAELLVASTDKIEDCISNLRLSSVDDLLHVSAKLETWSMMYLLEGMQAV